MQAFGSDEEFTETRRQAGMVMESGVMTPISDEFLTNFPEPSYSTDSVKSEGRIPLVLLLRKTAGD